MTDPAIEDAGAAGLAEDGGEGDRESSACTLAGPACPGTGRRRDKEATKRALLEAGMRVFATRGYDAATTREVAAAAGSNEQLIQRYFGGKAGLLLAVLERFASEDQRGACCGPPPQPDVESEIAGMLAYHLKHHWQCRDFIRVALYRALVDPAVAELMKRMMAENRLPILRQRLEGLRDRGLIAPRTDLDAVAAALSTLSFGLGFVDQVVLGQDSDTICTTIRSIARILAAGLAPGAAGVSGEPQAAVCPLGASAPPARPGE